MDGAIAGLVLLAVLVIFAVIVVAKSVALIPQAEAAVIERLGRYSKTVSGQLTLLLPFVDKIRARVDLRERVVSFPPQPVITEDNLTVNIDTVVYFQVTNPQAAVYQISNYIVGVEQLTTTTLRNPVGGMSLEDALTSRDQINQQLRGVLDEATGRWGLRVSRVELKSIMPPPSIQESMEKQMKAERDRRAAILNAEGVKQSQILTAEGEKQSAILRAEGSAQAAVLEAQGQSRAIKQVFDAIHRGKPTQKLLAYQYLQVLPQIATGDANKMWIIPSELTDALRGIGGALGGGDGDGPKGGLDAEEWVDPGPEATNVFDQTALEDPGEALAQARGQAGQASREASEHATPASRVQPAKGPGVRLPEPTEALAGQPPAPETTDAAAGQTPPPAPAQTDAPEPTEGPDAAR